MLVDVTDYDTERLAKYIKYIESHEKEKMYEIDDDVDSRFNALEFQRA